ncbi:head-tail adaptor protein [Rhizobium sp. AAP43]|uniref:head-tail adaptor protein n=1 Tax=Rhizobium sp. AAP43 TaxID=1523420 RepID=UPI0006B8A13F|nr:head-tail adaptor protein [Rhizobium sp. AAP43]KPF47071.1 phage head-tail adapter protein [Rhizobium sp. AAP43]
MAKAAGVGGAGKLRERISFAKRIDSEDGYGNGQGDWANQFTVAGGYTHLRGGETVIASRLENRHPVVIRVRASSDTRQVTADWKATDSRSDIAYAIRDVTIDPKGAFIDMLCESGVPI